MIKKILKTVSSRMFYLILGLFLALGIFVAQAAWLNPLPVVPGQSLTAASWNAVVNDLIDLNSRLSCPSCGTCWATRSNSTSCGLGQSTEYYEMCTPTGWKRTSQTTSNCSAGG